MCIRDRFNPPSTPIPIIATICPIKSGKYIRPEPSGLKTEYIKIDVPPTKAPHDIPKVKPAKKTVKKLLRKQLNLLLRRLLLQRLPRSLLRNNT